MMISVKRLINPAGALFGTATLFTIGLAAPRPSQADLHLSTPQIPSNAKIGAVVGSVNTGARISFDILLPYRNQALLDATLKSLYTPSSPTYRHFLTPDQFNAEFAPTEDTVARVSSYAIGSGLSVSAIAANHSFVRVTGTADRVEKMLGVNFQLRSNGSGRLFYTPDAEPLVPTAVQPLIEGFAGLSNQSTGHPDFIKVNKGTINRQELLNYTGNNGLSPADIKKIYGINNSTYDGSGETVALFEQGTFYPSDPQAYENTYGLPSPVYTAVSVDGFNTDPTVNVPQAGGAETEADLDMELLAAVAPGVKQVKVYETDDSGNTSFVTEVIDALNVMANDKTGRASVISISYGEDEQEDITQTEAEAENAQLEQLAAQGQTVCVASGDSGAFSYYDNGHISTDDPTSQPLVTSVGGTNLFDTISEQYEAEEGWSDPASGYEGGGGGISEYWPMPAYQTRAFNPIANPQGSLTNRNVPDVSLFADPTNGGYSEWEYDLYATGQAGSPWIGIGGTSCACPLWAAFFADVDQALQAQGEAPIGFANPLIYQIGESAAFNSDFNDVVLGDNLFYQATPGYDNATGWGTFKATSLFSTILSAPNIVSISPANVRSGSPATTVTITGRNLSGVKSASWYGYTLTGVKASATSVTGTVPAADLIQTVSAPIILSTASGTISSGLPFSVYSTPYISGVSPLSGPVGSRVVVSGDGFVNVSSVTFSGIRVTPVLDSSNALTLTVPAGAHSGPIIVTTPLGKATSPVFTVSNIPIVNHIFPNFSYASDPNAASEQVLITGTGFTPVTDVQWDGQDLGPQQNFAVEGDSLIGAQINTSTVQPSSAPFTIISPYGKVTTEPYTVLGPPSITSFTPTAALPGTTVTASGTNLQGVSEIEFNGNYIAAFPTAVSPTSVSFVVPSGAVTGQFAAFVPGAYALSPSPLTILSAPTIKSFTPTSGYPGTTVTITGTALTGVSSVTFGGGVSAKPLSSTATTVTVVVPVGVATGPISVTTPGGTAVSYTPFTLLSGPSIATFTPTSGPIGTVVTVSGSGLSGVKSAAVGNLPAGYRPISSTEVQITVPKGAPSSRISITTSLGTASSSINFTID